MRDLRDRTALLTGASRGIGPHIARALAGEGANLVLAARAVEGLLAVKAEAESLGVRAEAVPTDVSDPSALERLAAEAQARLGPVDLLVNNAGIEATLPYHRLTPEETRQVVEVNLNAPMLLTWLLLPGMLERKRGHIVHVSSLSGRFYPACNEPYAATKAGLVGFAYALRASYRRQGVSASVVCPGFVEAGMYERMQELGVSVPRVLGISSPQAVARGVVKAVKRDLPEVLVNPGPVRLLVGAAALWPWLGEQIKERAGLNGVFREIAAGRERERSAPEADAGSP